MAAAGARVETANHEEEVRTMTQRSTRDAAAAQLGGPAIALWLLAVLAVEIELYLWLFERWYS
jgi:hypothetical protein